MGDVNARASYFKDYTESIYVFDKYVQTLYSLGLLRLFQRLRSYLVDRCSWISNQMLTYNETLYNLFRYIRISCIVI